MESDQPATLERNIFITWPEGCQRVARIPALARTSLVGLLADPASEFVAWFDAGSGYAVREGGIGSAVRVDQQSLALL
jgi:hypothetical protein